MKPYLKMTLPLSLLILAGCASTPPAPAPVQRVPRMAPLPRPVHPAPPHHKKPHKKHAETTEAQARQKRHAEVSGREAAGSKSPAKTKPERPVVLFANDTSLVQQVTAALNNDPSLRGTRIHARAYQGNIALTGQVDNDAQKAKAVAIAGNVTGVKMVSDQLKVGK